MIINHAHRFIFIHVPKAAGTSVTQVLSPLTTYRDQEVGGTQAGNRMREYYATRFGLAKHSPAAFVRDLVGADVWGGYFTFAFVRNPYDRLVSAYRFLRGWDGTPAPVRARLDRLPTVQDFLGSSYWRTAPGPDQIFAPQTTWVCDPATGRPLVDFVGRTERLAQDLAAVMDRIGPPMPVPVGQANRSRGAAEPVVWTPEIAAAVRSRYAADFALFGYPVDPPELAQAA